MTVAADSPCARQCGMSEGQFKDGLMSIGFSQKDLSTGRHYGFGSKTAIPRVARYALVFTREEESRCRTVGLISSAFADSKGERITRLPLCSWEPSGRAIVSDTREEDAPLSYQARIDSLHAILSAQNCPYADAASILAEFDTLGSERSGGTGTRLIMWDIHDDILLGSKHDITFSEPAGGLPHEKSLRAYTEVLYLKVGTTVQPTMQIFLGGHKVEPRDWEAHLLEATMEYLLPKPQAKELEKQLACVSDEEARKTAQAAIAVVRLGYARPLREMYDILSSTQRDMQAAKHEMEECDTCTNANRTKCPVDRDTKPLLSLDDCNVDCWIRMRLRSGLFVYHKGRLTRALEKLKCQRKGGRGGRTSDMRALVLGTGLTGFISENYLFRELRWVPLQSPPSPPKGSPTVR
jgi:hypothetical protein